MSPSFELGVSLVVGVMDEGKIEGICQLTFRTIRNLNLSLNLRWSHEGIENWGAWNKSTNYSPQFLLNSLVTRYASRVTW